MKTHFASFQKASKAVLLSGALWGLAAGIAGCTKTNFTPGSSDNTLSVKSGVQQTEDFTFSGTALQKKVDILMVIDNSGSMQSLQNALLANFASFMNNFIALGYDFHLSVTTTDAYKALPQFNNDPSLAQFRDGAGTNQTGVHTILPSTANLMNIFMVNANQGISGSGDERAFSSLKAALSSPLNAGFLRKDSFMSIIILSDEDDFSDPTRAEGSWLNGGAADHDYNNLTLESVDSYVRFLDRLTARDQGSRRYNVSALTILDNQCLAQHKAESGVNEAAAALIGQRYIELANQTGGVLGSICDQNLSKSLEAIGNSVISQTTSSITLKRKAVPNSVSIDVKPQDPSLKWTVQGNVVTFNKAPAQGTQISVSYLSDN